ncbi:spore coat protein [Alteribacter aurantiacus]|uniref:spore coat protein n=1 Tax=Alteribacter aurantiacus TaxID=254410 RepID=UPI00041B7C57|nr:spore coat protein [Alteribacter aurantiacus]
MFKQQRPRRHCQVMPAQIHPTKQQMTHQCCEYIVPEVHPTHTTNVAHHLYKHIHTYPQTFSQVDQVSHQHFQGGPGQQVAGAQMGPNMGFPGQVAGAQAQPNMGFNGQVAGAQAQPNMGFPGQVAGAQAQPNMGFPGQVAGAQMNGYGKGGKCGR